MPETLNAEEWARLRADILAEIDALGSNDERLYLIDGRLTAIRALVEDRAAMRERLEAAEILLRRVHAARGVSRGIWTAIVEWCRS